MPIDCKDPFEKNAPTSLCQSNSFHSFNSNSKNNHNTIFIGSSKSSNCLTDVLIDDEELIDKLFPKCRPKSKTSSASSSKSDRTNGCVKRTNSSEQTRIADAEMLNASGGNSAPRTNIDQSDLGQNGRGEPRKGSNRKNYHPHNVPGQGRRLWNFMDISPSPSPPPLSPIEDVAPLTVAHDSYDSATGGDKFTPYPPTMERTSPVGQYQMPTFDYTAQREFLHAKDRFDINSLELNRASHETGECANIKTNSINNSNSFVAKSGSIDSREKNTRPPVNHGRAGAHFRLDSLLLSPDEQRDSSYKVSKLTSGLIRKNRFPVESDPNDEDDVLFSRMNTFASLVNNNKAMQPKPTSKLEFQAPVDKGVTLMDKREISSESFQNKLRPSQEETQGELSSGKIIVTGRNALKGRQSDVSDNDEDEEYGDGGFTERNRIELAGGKEIFSSSRSIRAKRRTSHGPSKMVSDLTSEQQGSGIRGLSRHTQLFSVSMAADVGDRAWEQCTPPSATAVAVAACKEEQQQPRQTQERHSDRPQQQQTQTQPMVTPGADRASLPTTDNDSNLVRAHFTPSIPATSSFNPHHHQESAKPREPLPAPRHSRKQSLGVECDGSDSRSSCLPSQSDNNLKCPATRTSRESSQAINTASHIKSTMILEGQQEVSPRVSTSDNVVKEPQPATIFSKVAEEFAHHEENTCESKSNICESTDQSDTQTNERLDVEQELCGPMEQSLNMSCDQFARDLKKRLDIVSNNTETRPEHIAELETEIELNSDNNSVKSPSLSQKSFEAKERIARVIGSVPIAQYEGSPKRYGPKPGYPKRVLSSSSNASNDYETISPQKQKVEPACDRTDEPDHKSALLSSENGSPHSSTSSTSSATFSSTDIHSSSSFSCPSNQRNNANFPNWNIQSIAKKSYPGPPTDLSERDRTLTNHDERTLVCHKPEANFKAQQVTCDEIVKTILSIPSGLVDTEDEDVTSASDKPAELDLSDVPLGPELSRIPNEPNYSSITSSGYSVDPNKSSGYSSKRSLHSDDSESVTKSKISISSNGCDRNIAKSATSIKAYAQQGDIPTANQLDSNNKPASQQQQQQQRLNESHNVLKLLRHDPYSRQYMEASQSFESTDSSYRSDKYSNKDLTQSDDDLYMYGQKNQPTKPQTISCRLNSNSLDGRNLLEPLPLSYTGGLSPELNSQSVVQPKSKLFINSTFESVGFPIDQQGSYSPNAKNDKDSGLSGTSVRMNTMPVLEDGLSSGIPSSDEMDYEYEEEGDDDLITHEHDLDDYVNEYNNSRGVPCDPLMPPSQYANRLEMVNGNSGNNFDFHYKQKSPNEYPTRAHKVGDTPMYRCATKAGTPFGLELSEDRASKDSHDFYSGHNHQLNQHMHNHPLLDDTSPRATLTPPYENEKHISGKDISCNHGKFCISSQLRSSVSNSSSNNSSMSTVRNATGSLGNSAGPKPSVSPPPAVSSLHHYHHHYHNHHSGSSLPVTSRQNYPNLSSSPTSLSPNSPGGPQQSSASSSSSSSHPTSSGAHHYRQQPPHQNQTVPQSQEMAAANSLSLSPSNSMGCVAAPNVRHHHDEDCDTDQETDRLLGSQRGGEDRGYYDDKVRVFESAQLKRSSTSREAFPPKVLIEGVLFRARYLGSTQLVCDGQPTKATRMMQAEEAVSRIKAPEGETQPSTEVDLFISTEKIMVLNTDLKEIMMDHALRTISYIADIGDLLVLMARRRTPIDDPNDSGIKRIPKMICHVFESEEAQYIAQSIGQAFQVAYMEFLKANGIEDSGFLKEMDYQEVLNSQEIFGNELEMFARREKQKEVIVPKQKGEILGIVIVESGWGSMLPTVVIANMAQSSPSARCGQLNIGDQIIAINGISLVGLPLSTCQAYVKNTKNQTAVKFTIVPCAPVVEVKIKRPDTKYQLGFSVQNGVICSLLRGGIAERGGVRVGHRIIEINGQSVVAVPHDRIVNLLATSVGEIHMKTMPTSMFRLLTGQDSPSFM